MAERTYLWGYFGQRRTRATIDSYWQISALHPEMRRRTWAICNAALNSGHDLGIGGGTRTYAQQAALYKARNGIGVAPPGYSYHEVEATPLGALAVDFVGDTKYLAVNSKAFHLLNFDYLGEQWHSQIAEVPPARGEYKQNPTKYPILNPTLPGGSAPLPPTPPPPAPANPPPVITPGEDEGEGMFRIAGKELLADGKVGRFTIGNGRTRIWLGGDLPSVHQTLCSTVGGMVDAKTRTLQKTWSGVQTISVAELDRICGRVRP